LENVTSNNLSVFLIINSIDASLFDKGTAYIA